MIKARSYRPLSGRPVPRSSSSHHVCFSEPVLKSTLTCGTLRASVHPVEELGPRKGLSMAPLANEIGLAARSLRKSPGFAVTAIITLALGIGASTAIFSVVNAVLLRPLPYKDPERLAIVWDDLRNRNVTNFPFAAGDFNDLREQATLFQGFAGVSTGRQAITDDVSKPEMVKARFATTNIFSL